LINEIEKAEELLSGKSFKKEYFFSAYCVLIKYFLGKGLSPQDVRQKIIEWEEKYGHQRYFDLNDVILKFYNDKVVAKGEFKINISENDVAEIKSRFDNVNQIKIAFALLCYAKVNADKNGCFYISYAELSDWISMNIDNVRKRHIAKLIQLNYIEKVRSKSNKSTFTWDKDKNKNYYQKNKFKINIDYSNDFNGRWVLEDNDILKLFSEIFSK
jgi:hypothetical protein